MVNASPLSASCAGITRYQVPTVGDGPVTLSAWLPKLPCSYVIVFSV